MVFKDGHALKNRILKKIFGHMMNPKVIVLLRFYNILKISYQ